MTNLSVTTTSPAKATEPIMMPFGILTRVGLRNHMVDGVQIHTRRGNFEGEKRPAQDMPRTFPVGDILKATQ